MKNRPAVVKLNGYWEDSRKEIIDYYNTFPMVSIIIYLLVMKGTPEKGWGLIPDFGG